MKVMKENFRWCVNVDDRVIYLQLRNFTKLKNFNYKIAATFIMTCNIILTTIFGFVSQGDNYFIVSLTVSVVLAIIFYYLFESYGAPVVKEIYMGVKNDEKIKQVKALKDLLNGLKATDETKYEKIIAKLNGEKINEVIGEIFAISMVNNKTVHSGSTRLDSIAGGKYVQEINANGGSNGIIEEDFITLPANKITLSDREDITLEEFEKLNNDGVKANPYCGVYVRGSIVSDADKKRLSSLNSELNEYSRKFNGLIIKNQSLTNVIDKLKKLGRNYLYMNKTNKSIYLEIFDETLNLFNIMENSGVGTTVDHVDEVKWKDNFDKLSLALMKLEADHYGELNERLIEQNIRIDKVFKIK